MANLINLLLTFLLYMQGMGEIYEAQTYNGLMDSYHRVITHQMILVEENMTDVHIYFGVGNQWSNVVLMVDWKNITTDITPKDITNMYVHPKDDDPKIDFEGVFSKQEQFVKLDLPSNYLGKTLYINMFNLDFPERRVAKNFYLYINYEDQNQHYCLPCPFGFQNISNNLTCQCSPCLPYTYGNICQNQVEPMQEDEVYTFTLVNYQNMHYRIPNPPKITKIYFNQDSKVGNKIVIYVQYEVKEGDIAGKLNNYYEEDGTPLKKYLSSDDQYIQLIPGGRSITLTVQSQWDIKSTDVKVWYEDPQKTHLGLILGLIFGILGALFILGLAICCCIRKNRKKVQNSDRGTTLEGQQHSNADVAHSEVCSQKTKAKATFPLNPSQNKQNFSMDNQELIPQHAHNQEQKHNEQYDESYSPTLGGKKQVKYYSEKKSDK